MILTKEAAVVAAYSAEALAGALLVAIHLTPKGERIPLHRRRDASGRARARSWANEALKTPSDSKEYVDKIQWGKMMLRIGGLGEHYNSRSRIATARILLAVRDLYREQNKYLLIARTMGLSKLDIAVIALTAPSRFQLAEKAIEILESDGWRSTNGARNADARYVFNE